MTTPAEMFFCGGLCPAFTKARTDWKIHGEIALPMETTTYSHQAAMAGENSISFRGSSISPKGSRISRLAKNYILPPLKDPSP